MYHTHTRAHTRTHTHTHTHVHTYTPRDNVATGAFHSTLHGQACVTFGWNGDGVMLRPDNVVAKRSFRCAGKNLCEDGRACKVRLMQIIYNDNPLRWVVWRNTSCPLLDAQHFRAGVGAGTHGVEPLLHCPFDPTKYMLPVKRRLGLEVSKSIARAHHDGLTAGRWLCTQRANSFAASLALKNQARKFLCCQPRT
jgi:hypothetical protein